MAGAYEYLKGKSQQLGLRSAPEFAGFLQKEREAYWRNLQNAPLDDATRQQRFEAFDREGARLHAEMLAGKTANAAAALATPDAKPRTIRRDLMLILIGAAVGIPASLLTNYFSSTLFPATVSFPSTVSVQQAGVQQLSAPRKEFIFMQSSADRQPRDGTIDVVYAMGIESAGYKCTVKVSDQQFFEHVTFDKACTQVTFKFIDPALFFKKTADFKNLAMNNTAVFSIEIVTEKGQMWRGSQGIEFAVVAGI